MNAHTLFLTIPLLVTGPLMGQTPAIDVTPTSLSAALYTGGQDTQVVQIGNTGASDLIYSITVEYEGTQAVSLEFLGNLDYPQDVSDVWGYSAPDGTELAIMGTYSGTAFIDVSTNPSQPVEVAFISGPSSSWRDIKTFDHYAYIVTEGGGGLQIVDLADPMNPVLASTYTASFNSAHNLFIDEAGFAYIVGSWESAASGGLHILDLSNPENPVVAGNWSDRYVHDLYVRNDTAYAACIWDGLLEIIDVTNKSNPTRFAGIATSGLFTHTVWLTDDGDYALTTDEVTGGYVDIYDIRDLTSITRVAQYQVDPNHIPHNLFVKGNLAYLSAYVDGVVVLDISDPTNPVLAGQYDTHEGLESGYAGAWGVYPFALNNFIYVSDMQSGLYVLEAHGWLGTSPDSGTVATGSSVDVNVTFDASGLGGGSYDANMVIASNDPVNPVVSVAVSLVVTAAPHIAVSADTLDFGQVFVNSAASLELLVTNAGSEPLYITGVAADPIVYTVIPPVGTINPGEIDTFLVTLAPTALVGYPGTLTFMSNDPDEGSYVVVLLGQGVDPPIISVTPDSLSDSLFTGGTLTQIVTIDNTAGGSDLFFDISVVSPDAVGMSATASFTSAPQAGGGIFRKPRHLIANQAALESSGKSAFSEGQSSFHSRHSETIGGPSANAAEATSNRDMSNWSQSQVGAADSDISLNSMSHRQVTQIDNPALTNANIPRVLLLSNNGPDWDFTGFAKDGLISTGLFADSDIDILNDPLSISLADLTSYDALLVWTNFNFSDPQNIGDVLKQYVDQGGGVVLATYAYSTLWAIQGGILEPDYSPFIPALIQSVSGQIDMNNLPYPDHPIFRNISTTPTYWNNSSYSNPPLNEGGMLLAQDTFGNNVVAENPTGKVVGIIVFPGILNVNNNDTNDATRLMFANALYYVRTFSWLSADPISGTIPAGSSMDIGINFDAAGLSGGDYHADIVITSNDPITPESRIPVHLVVTGAADITVSADTLDFGKAFVGYADTLELVVENDGTDDLIITGALADPAQYTVMPSSVTIVPGEDQIFLVRLLPTAVGGYPGTLTLTSNDPDEGTTVIILQGQAVLPPIIAVMPDSLIADLLSGDSSVQYLTIDNSAGGSDLIYEILVEAVAGDGAPAPARLGLAKPLAPAGYHPSGSSLTDLLRGDRRRAQGKAVKERLPLSSSTATPGLTAAPVWRLLHTDPEEPGLTYDIQSVYGGVTSDEILFKLESYNTVPTDAFVVIAIDADQDTSTGFIIEDFYSWRLGIDYVIEIEPPFEAGLLRWELEGFLWADSLTSFSGEAGSYEMILGVDRAHFEAFPAVNFAVLAAGVEGLDQVPDFGQGHIVFPFAPAWLRLSSLEGVIAAGAQEALAVTFDAEGLFGGDYRANIVVASNDPASPQRIVPAQLAVTGIPHISIEVDSVDFGASFVGYLDSVFLRIDNVGTDVLEITDVVSGSVLLTAEPASLSIPPASSDLIRLYLLVTTDGTFSSTITLVSNDPDAAEVSLPVSSVVVIAPDITLTPNEVLLTARPDSAATALLTIANSGGSDLNYTLSVAYPTEGTGGENIASLDQGGGPDAFGYRWKDSNEPGGPAFEWIDASDGTTLSLGDDDYVTGIPLGFDFSYYGETFSQINIMSNGWVSFTDYGIFLPEMVPDPYNEFTGVIAPFAGDLYPPLGQVRYKTIGTVPSRVFVVEYNQVPWYSSAPPYMTFEVLFYESGNTIRFQYLDLQGATPWGIGISSPDNTTGLGNGGSDITYIDPAIVGDNYALEFSARTEWLTMEPSSGSVAMGDSVVISLSADVGELQLGSYHVDILVSSNDPDEGRLVVPVTLSVTLGVEAGLALPQSFALHQNYPNPFNPTATIRFDMPQSAQVSLVVYDLLGRRVAELVSQEIEPGYHSVTWNARGNTGRNLASGIYIARLHATPTAGVRPQYTKSIKMLLLK